jgi:hypothetical protein
MGSQPEKKKRLWKQLLPEPFGVVAGLDLNHGASGYELP